MGRVADHLHLAGGGAAQSRDVADRARHLFSAWRATDSGAALAVRVTPRASRDGWGKHAPEHFGVRIAAPPVRSEDRRVGQACVSTFSSWGSSTHLKQNQQ